MTSATGRKRHLDDIEYTSAPRSSKQPRYDDDSNNVVGVPIPSASSNRLQYTHQDNGTILKHKQLGNGDYTVGWVAALPIERAAAQAVFDEEHEMLPKTRGDTNCYTFGRIGHHNCVIASLPMDGKGIVNAATVSSNMHRTFPSIKVFLMVGIAGGVSGTKDVRLGDVVVSTKLIRYDEGKSLGENHFKTTSIPLRPSQELRNAVGALEAQHELAPSKIPDILRQIAARYPLMERYTCREELQDLLFEDSYEHPTGFGDTCNQCDQSRLVIRKPRPSNHPVIHHGVIASGDQVIKNATTRDRLQREFEALCFEMEGAGVIENLQCLVIRSICDYADSHKNKEWQRYAAAVAAAYTKELLGNMPVLESHMPQIEKLIKALSFPSMDTRRDNIESACDKTCEWILDHPAFEAWLDPEEYAQTHGFFWIRGKPGAGKSTLMKFILSHVRKTHPTVISFFFNARGDGLEKSIEGMYQALLWQLLQKFPDLQLLDHPHLRILDFTDHFEWTTRSLEDLFTNAIAGLGEQEVTCFIDALDECELKPMRKMVKHFENLGRLAAEKRIKLFICFSSRHYPSIAINTGEILILEDQTGHDKDLENYVAQELNIGDETDTLGIRAILLKKADGVFLWVILVVRILNEDYLDGRYFGLKEKLKQVPSGLGQLFENISKRDSRNGADLLLSIQWILFARQPLRPRQYYYVMAAGLDSIDSSNETMPMKYSIQITNDAVFRFVTSSSKGLAEVSRTEPERERVVQFIHESVHDYLIKDGGIYKLWPQLRNGFESQSHNRLKDCCDAYIKSRLCQRWLQDFEVREDEPARVKVTHWENAIGEESRYRISIEFLHYATSNILNHAEMAAIDISQQDFLQKFDLRTWIRVYDLLVDSSHYTLHQHMTPYPSTLSYVLALEGHARLMATAAAIRGAEVNSRNSRGRTPLSSASIGCRSELALILLDGGADVNSRDLSGQTPLFWAAWSCNPKTIQILLNRGADSSLKDINGQTPL
ncbi:hypothetical protein F4808DRAFT_448850 [Astrocystis sublimbata]|nr:hypothetical protein F4808DRAFT_448850 [Astrocystis sublimbata]